MTKSFAHLLVLIALFVFVLPPVAAQRDRRPAKTASEADDLIAIPDVNDRIKALEEFLKQKPSGSKASDDAREALVMSWAELGSADLAENRITPAMERFQKAIAELPAEVSDKLFDETVARIPFVIARRGYREDAVRFARSLESRFSKEPPRLGVIGEFYLNVEAPLDAIRVLEAGLAISKNELKLRRPLAAAYRMSLRLDEAAKELEQIAALDEKDPRALIELGNIARAKGEYEQALRYYRGYLNVDPESIPAYKGIALTAGAQGENSAVEEALTKIRTLKNEEEVTKDIHLQTQFAFYLLGLNKNPEANVAIVNALAIEPRYSWARIAAAELDISEGRIFEAEKHLLSALRTSDFPTLRFTLGKLYAAVEDFDGALEQFNKAFSITKSGKFSTRLGGVLQKESADLDELLAPERQASIFIAKTLTTPDQFTLMESLVRFDAKLSELSKSKPAAQPVAQTRRTRAVKAPAETELENQINAFVSVEGTRRPFRALYAAQRLSRAGVALPLAIKLTDQVIETAEAAVAEEGSLPEFPNYDRDGRLRVVRGRALDARGWALFQLKRNKEAVASLTDAVEAFGNLPEAKDSQWRLATVKETIGEQKEALDLYIAGYYRPANGESADVKRTVIESLYKKVNGSLDGLDEKLGAPAQVASASSKPASRTSIPTNLATPPAPKPAPTEAIVDPPRSVVEENLPRPTSAEGVRLPRVRMNRLLLLNPIKPEIAVAPSPDSIPVEIGRKRRVSEGEEPVSRPRRIAKP